MFLLSTYNLSNSEILPFTATVLIFLGLRTRSLTIVALLPILYCLPVVYQRAVPISGTVTGRKKECIFFSVAGILQIIKIKLKSKLKGIRSVTFLDSITESLI